MQYKRVVLLGGSGFVGSNLQRFLPITMVVPSEAQADVTKRDSLRGVISPDDIVINAAGYANATDDTARGRELCREVNVHGVANLAHVCNEIGVAQLIHLSSVAAMGKVSGEDIDEATRGTLSSHYAKSKAAGEVILEGLMGSFPITILRPTSVFGEGRGLARVLCSLVSKGVLLLPGGGKARIPFTYIGNVARCVELCVANGACIGRTFIIGDDHAYEFREISMRLAVALGTKPAVIDVPDRTALAMVMLIERVCKCLGRPPLMDRGRLETLTSTVSYSIASFKRATGFEPPYSLDESLIRIASWYRMRRVDDR